MGDLTNGEGRIAVTGAERMELASVLASPTFARSQRLIKLLDFICERHFEGRDAELCEYAVATEVLGRPPEFDPADDAIARVEIHRLRKKLRDHYATDGARQELKIIIPPGMYAPVFQQDGSVAPAPQHTGKRILPPGGEPHIAPVLDEPGFQPVVLPPRPPRRRTWIFVAAALLVLLVVLVTVGILRNRGPAEADSLPLAPAPVPAAAPDGAIRIIAGYDRKYIDRRGHTWLPDRYFEGGGQPRLPSRQFIARTSDPLLYQTGRIGLTAYNFPLKPGNYELKLHFVEPVYGPGLVTGGGENSRVFDVLVNGKLAMDSLDIVSDAGGPLIADIRVLKDLEPGPDGILRVSFHAKREQPIISAIEIEAAPLHHINPIRIVTQPNSVTDSTGQVWEADDYYLGGQTSNHYKVVDGTPDSDLFANERYGHFSYAIPVAPGVYTATMYFAETYWGSENEGGGGPGQRIFDIYANGLALLRNFDILREAGPNHAIVKHFRGLRPTAQGKLNFDFVPVVNYASLFAIKIEDETR